MQKCSMTGLTYHDFTDGIYDDGEWISWDWINGQIYEQDLREYESDLSAAYPKAEPIIVEIFQNLVGLPLAYKEITGRYLQIWGELGELYAEVEYGLKRHKPHTQGSDGRLDKDWVEVKTISPEKGDDKVFVKRAGNFNKLLVVKINEEFEFEAKMIDRKKLKKGVGKNARVSWNSVEA